MLSCFFFGVVFVLGMRGGDVMRFIPCFENVSIGVHSSPETMPWYQHHWAGLAFGAWIRKCLAPWWPLFKCTKKWWHYWSRVGRIPTTNTLVSMFDFWVYNDISPRALLFSNGWLLVWGPCTKGTQQWTTSWREEKLLKNSLPETDGTSPLKIGNFYILLLERKEPILFQLSILQVRSPVSFREGEPGRSTSPNSFSPSSGEIFRMDPKKVTTKRFGGFLVVCHKQKNALPGGSFGWNASWKHHAAWRFRFLVR